MIDVIGIFNKASGYVSSVTTKLGAVGGKVFSCITSVDWSDLWSSPKYPLDQTFKNIKDEIKTLWNTLMDLVMGKKKEVKKDDETKSRRRRHVLEDK